MIEYFKYLSKSEVEKFEQFVNSPYHNNSQRIIKLFDYLYSKYPDIEPKVINREAISSSVYPSEKYNDTNIRKLLSKFTAIFEKFLVQLEFENEERRNKTLLLRSLRVRSMNKRFESNFKEISELQSKSFSKDDSHYENQFNLERENYYFNFNKLKFTFASCLQSKSDVLDYHFIFSKLHTFNEMFNSQRISGKILPYNKTFLNEIISFIEANKRTISLKHPNIYIIYHQIMMSIYNDVKYLNELFRYIKVNEKKFSKVQLSYYYYYLASYFMHEINKGQLKYFEEVFKIYKIMWNKDFFLIDNTLTDLDFNSIVNTGLAMKEFEWVEQFIDKYKNNIERTVAKDAYNMARAKIFFYKKDYNNVFPHLSNINYKDPNYYFNSKSLLGRVYYEMKNIDGVRYIIENLRQYLREKQTLTREYIQVISTFNKYMMELIKLSEKKAANRKSGQFVLRKELDNEKKFVSHKSWFYEKINEL